MVSDEQKQQRLTQAGWEHTGNGVWWLPGKAGLGKTLDEAYNYLHGQAVSETITTGDPFSDLCWYCELCGTEIAIDSEDAPLPDGWKIVRMRTGIGMGDVVVCDKCLAKEKGG